MASGQPIPIKLWNWDSWTILLEPCVGANFTADLLIRIAWAAFLSNPVRQGKPHHQLSPGISSLAININSDADVEAAMDPVLHINSTTCIRGTEAEMMGDGSFYQLAISVQMGKISNLLIPISQLMQDISVLFLCGGVCDLSAKQATFPQSKRIMVLRHSSRPMPLKDGVGEAN